MSKKISRSKHVLRSTKWFGRHDRDGLVHHLHVSEAELARRKSKWKAPQPHADRGWVNLYCETVTQADQGVDLDFLVGKSGAKVGRESH